MVLIAWASAAPWSAHAERGRALAPRWAFRDAGLEEPRHAVSRAWPSRSAAARRTLTQFLGEIVEHLVPRRLDVGRSIPPSTRCRNRRAVRASNSGLPFRRHFACRHVDDDGRSVFAVDEGALEREIDEAVATPFCQIGIWRSNSGVREAGCKAASSPARGVDVYSILLRNRKRGTPSSSSSRSIS